MKRLAFTMLTAACVVAPAAYTSASTVQAQGVSRPATDIVVSIGRGQLVSVGGTMADVFVANEAIADVQVKSPRQLYVFGKAGGETTIYASDAAGNVIWSANVRVGSNIESVDQMLNMAMPDAKITVSTMGTNTFLMTGTVAAPEDAAEAQRLVQAYVGKEANVITRLKMATPLQVNLSVKFAEVSRSLVKEMGSNLFTRDQSGGVLFGLSRGRNAGSVGNIDTSGLPLVDASSQFGLPADTLKLPFDPASGKFITGGTQYKFNANASGQTAINLAGRLFGLDVGAAFDIGEKLGLITTISSPNLTALSGETGDFLAGGEYPIPVSQGMGTTTIEYKKYGVSLSYSPTVLANGRISLRVRPEVSELSNQGAVSIGGYTIPALTVRRAETTVEMGSGQSMMIAGLMNNNAQNTVEKLPGAGDLPIVGALFKSTMFRRGETEMVIVITPYLVQPVNANEIKLPTDGYENPNDIQRLLGNMENGQSGKARPMPTQAPPQPGGPQVGDLIAPGSAPIPQAASAGGKDKKKKRKKGESDDVVPGFSLN